MTTWPWSPLIEEAGGTITDWSGNPLGLDSKGDVLAAASRELHEEALTI
jgi:inositol-phosphate phosphatase/L-galactose 1-phosphate phosphatase/histidinol-phosphatase